jgi:hypothetical protein
MFSSLSRDRVETSYRARFRDGCSFVSSAARVGSRGGRRRSGAGLASGRLAASALFGSAFDGSVPRSSKSRRLQGSSPRGGCQPLPGPAGKLGCDWFCRCRVGRRAGSVPPLGGHGSALTGCCCFAPAPPLRKTPWSRRSWSRRSRSARARLRRPDLQARFRPRARRQHRNQQGTPRASVATADPAAAKRNRGSDRTLTPRGRYGSSAPGSCSSSARQKSFSGPTFRERCSRE